MRSYLVRMNKTHFEVSDRTLLFYQIKIRIICLKKSMWIDNDSNECEHADKLTFPREMNYV